MHLAQEDAGRIPAEKSRAGRSQRKKMVSPMQKKQAEPTKRSHPKWAKTGKPVTLHEKIERLKGEVASLEHIEDFYAKLRDETGPTAEQLDRAQAALPLSSHYS
ncbi:MAG: hypothetical protein ACI8PG_002635 [Planctomycetota bacterium]